MNFSTASLQNGIIFLVSYFPKLNDKNKVSTTEDINTPTPETMTLSYSIFKSVFYREF